MADSLQFPESAAGAQGEMVDSTRLPVLALTPLALTEEAAGAETDLRPEWGAMTEETEAMEAVAVAGPMAVETAGTAGLVEEAEPAGPVSLAARKVVKVASEGAAARLPMEESWVRLTRETAACSEATQTH